MFGFDFEHGGAFQGQPIGMGGGGGLLTKFCRNRLLFWRIKQTTKHIMIYFKFIFMGHFNTDKTT